MPRDLAPEDVLGQLEKERLFPFYLFYGEGEFRLEKVLSNIREAIVPEESRAFNFQVFYGDQANPADILDSARSFPFISHYRLIFVRRTEDLKTSAMESFLPYLESPVQTTCLIFVASRADFRKRFFKRMREMGRSVNFRKLYDNEVVPWIKRMAKDLGLDMEGKACAYLQQMVGNRLRDLYTELEKLYLRHGAEKIGVEEVKALAIHSRIYTVFELMDAISWKKKEAALSTLRRFLQEEGREAPRRLVGMLNRQVRLLWQTRERVQGGGKGADVARKLGLQAFQVRSLVPQSKKWSEEELERAVYLLYEADGLLKSGSDGSLVLENLILSVCG
jgi:DNA polymerase-3 subunit delta